MNYNCATILKSSEGKGLVKQKLLVLFLRQSQVAQADLELLALLSTPTLEALGL